MNRASILFADPAGQQRALQPAFFVDLNLDQLVHAITIGREDYELDEYFWQPLHDPAQVEYRHEVIRDLESEALRRAIDTFAGEMQKTRDHLAHADKLRYRRQKQAVTLAAAHIYIAAVTDLATNPVLAHTNSAGFRSIRNYLAGYTQTGDFAALVADAAQVAGALSTVEYCLRINGNRITVTRYAGQDDYTAEVEATFQKFQQGAVTDYRVKVPVQLEMNHVEAEVLELVASLYPDTFTALTDFATRYAGFIDTTVAAFDRQVQFYIGYLHFIGRLHPDLRVCLPQVSSTSKELQVAGAFDVMLADKFSGTDTRIITNSFSLTGQERILVVTGPNQGGKTTFARTVGQLHYLAALGLPVPASSAQLVLPDQLFTHFEKEEDPTALRGKLEDDLQRIHDILEHATGDSLVIMNELFSSTTLVDAISLGSAVLGTLIERGCLGVCVTFVDELSRLGGATVSLVSAVDPTDPTVRTFKLDRRPADGLAYAISIAEKYGLTHTHLTEQFTG